MTLLLSYSFNVVEPNLFPIFYSVADPDPHGSAFKKSSQIRIHHHSTPKPNSNSPEPDPEAELFHRLRLQLKSPAPAPKHWLRPWTAGHFIHEHRKLNNSPTSSDHFALGVDDDELPIDEVVPGAGMLSHSQLGNTHRC